MREVRGGREVRRREVGGENFGAKKGAEKSLGREEDVFLVHPQNGLNGHPELVHLWLLVHSGPFHGQRPNR